MNTGERNEVFDIYHHTNPQTEFMWEKDVTDLEAELMRRVAGLRQGDTLVVDFSKIGMSSGAARQFLKRVLVRIQGGDLHGRGLVLRSLGRGLYDIQAMLEWEGLTAVAQNDRGEPTLIGAADQALLETYQFLAKRSSVVAREVRDEFGLKTVAAATNRLVRLASIGAVRRVGQEPAEGGGLQYRYAAMR